MNVKVIKNESDYEAALERLSELLRKEYSPGSQEENELELLVLVIQEYEQKRMKPLDLDPVEAIQFRMEQMQLSKKDLVPFMGSESKISEVFSGKRRLSLSMIRALHEEFDIPLESLIGQSSKPSLHYHRKRFPLRMKRGFAKRSHKITVSSKRHRKKSLI